MIGSKYEDCSVCTQKIPHSNNISYVLTIRDDIEKEVRFLSFCSMECLNNYIINHIADSGKMVEEKPNNCDCSKYKHRCVNCNQIVVKDGELYCKKCDAFHKIWESHVCETQSKKLKPVDENCLYKPVMIDLKDPSVCIPGQVTYLGILSTCDFKEMPFCIFSGGFINVIDLRSYELYRIENYDYGDGGNYL